MRDLDFVEKNYERIATDPDYRARLLADPVGVVCEEFGYTPTPKEPLNKLAFLSEEVNFTLCSLGRGIDASIELCERWL